MKRFLVKALTLSLLLASFAFVIVANSLATTKAFAATVVAAPTVTVDNTVQVKSGVAIATGKYSCRANSGNKTLRILFLEAATAKSPLPVQGLASTSNLTCDGAFHTYTLNLRSSSGSFTPSGFGLGSANLNIDKSIIPFSTEVLYK
jgi:hypothetical protein